jgi:L-fucose isomerase-like protein
MNRREFLSITTGALAGVGLTSSLAVGSAAQEAVPADWDPERPLVVPGRPLRIQPVLIYATAQRKEATSWKSWGGVQSEDAASQEVDRITKELAALRSGAAFPLDILPVAKIKTVEEANRLLAAPCDVVLVFPATGGGGVLRACLPPDRHAIVFVRHRSGPVYYWYEALSVQYLRPDGAGPQHGNASVHDVVVDDYQDVLWRLRGLHGVKNLLGSRIVALGGTLGKYAPDAPQLARERYKLEITDVGYDTFEPRIRGALANAELMSKAGRWADQYLALPGTTLVTEKSFLVNAFALYHLFKQLMREHGAQTFTIKSCMGTIMPMSKTTACLSLSLLNDEGLLAFCESDFVVIPAGILLRHVSGRPVFMHNSTFPHKGMVTCAHCTSPRRMIGADYEPARIVTHYESDYGAAPKVELPKGQTVTFVNPEYSKERWLGFRGTVESNPAYEICVSQQDVQIQGNWRRLINEVRDSHWMMVCGDHLDAVEYAARKIGIAWESLFET